MKNQFLIAAFAISLILTTLLGIIANIVSTYLAPQWQAQPEWVYAALIIVFLLSLLISIYIFKRTLPDPSISRSQSSTSAVPLSSPGEGSGQPEIQSHGSVTDTTVPPAESRNSTSSPPIVIDLDHKEQRRRELQLRYEILSKNIQEWGKTHASLSSGARKSEIAMDLARAEAERDEIVQQLLSLDSIK